PLTFAVDLATLYLGISIDAVQPAVRPAAKRETLHSLGPAVVEDVNGPAARREHRWRNQRREYRIFVVLAAIDNPHIHAVLAHENGEDTVEAGFQPLLLDV